MLLTKFLFWIKKIYHLKILKKRYFRHGKCLMCGACCECIYVRHDGKVIKTKEEFEEIKKKDSYSFYQHITIVDVDEAGVIFKCDKFDTINRICTDYKNRPSICRNYPSEEIFSFGASLQDKCGFSFEPIEKFSEVFKKVSKKPVKKFSEFED